MSDAWGDLFDEPSAPMNLTMPEDAWIARVQGAPAPEEQPETGASASQASSDEGGLFGPDDQFTATWQHWQGMPEFHMENLDPESTVVVKFRTAEDREAFAKAIGREVRKEEPRGIWYPNIVIAHFWDKRYRDVSAEATVNAPVLSEADEVEDEDTTEEELTA